MALLARDLGLLFIMAPHTGCTATGRVLRKDLKARWLPNKKVDGPDGKLLVPRKHTTLPQLVESGVLEGAFTDPGRARAARHRLDDPQPVRRQRQLVAPLVSKARPVSQEVQPPLRRARRRPGRPAR